MQYIWIVILSCIVIYIWQKIFRRFKILDRPWPDVPKRDKVPTAQWVFMIIAFLLSILIFYHEYFFMKEFIWLAIGILLIWLVATIDSFKRIDTKIRLLIQIVVALIALFIWWVWFDSFVFPWWFEIEFHWIIASLFTIIWFVGFINAINWFDGIYGMASWVSTVGFLTILLLVKFVVLQMFPDMSVEKLINMNMVINISFIMFVISFLATILEFKPRWVVRDVGTMFMWFVLAYLALMWGAKIGTIMVALSLVIFDAIWVVINRMFIMKKSPLKWDYSHLHHRLLVLWWSRTETRFFIWWWSLFLMILMILQWSARFNKIIIFVLMFIIFFWVNIYLYWIKKLPMEYIKKNKD